MDQVPVNHWPVCYWTWTWASAAGNLGTAWHLSVEELLTHLHSRCCFIMTCLWGYWGGAMTSQHPVSLQQTKQQKTKRRGGVWEGHTHTDTNRKRLTHVFSHMQHSAVNQPITCCSSCHQSTNQGVEWKHETLRRRGDWRGHRLSVCETLLPTAERWFNRVGAVCRKLLRV